jgi:hypothetical protein
MEFYLPKAPLVLLLLLAFAACEPSTQKHPQHSFTLVLKDSLDLKTDSLSPPLSPYMQGLETDSGFYLIRLNTLMNSLDYFSMESGEMSHREKIHRLGRYGAGDLIAFHRLHGSEVLLLSALRLSKTTAGNPEIEENVHINWPAFGNQAARTYRPIMEDDEAFYIPFQGLPGVKDFDNKRKLPSNSLMVKVYKEKAGYENLVEWPEDLEKEMFPPEMYDYSVTKGHLQGQFVFSFPHRENLLLSDLYEMHRWTKAGGGKAPVANSETSTEPFPMYGPVYFDAYRTVYLRFVREDHGKNKLYLLDTEFRRLNVFDAEMLPDIDPKHLIIGKEGWWIRHSDPNTPRYYLISIE